MKTINDLTADYVREILDYNPETGVFKWKWREGVSKCINARYSGKKAGNVRTDGYVLIRINFRLYQAHRLAWLIVHGEWPPKDLDHIDGGPGNNRIDNLRIATRNENMRNRKQHKNNATGIKGVHWGKRDRKFVAQIMAGNKRLHLGSFATLAEAAAAREAAEIKYFGDFRRAA